MCPELGAPSRGPLFLARDAERGARGICGEARRMSSCRKMEEEGMGILEGQHSLGGVWTWWWMGDWRSEWVRWRGEPGTRQGRALKRGCSGGLGRRLCDGERDATQERELEIGPGKAKGARHGGRTWLACPDQSCPPRRKTAAGHPFAYPPPFLVWPRLGPRNSPATSPYCHRPGPVVGGGVGCVPLPGRGWGAARCGGRGCVLLRSKRSRTSSMHAAPSPAP